MSYLNSGVAKPAALPVAAYHIDTALSEYDLNFCYPVKPLTSEAVRVEPFIPAIHAREAWLNLEGSEGQDLFRFLPFPTPKTFDEYLTFVESKRSLASRGWCNFAIIDNARYGKPTLAGLISLINADAAALSVELGCVIIFPAYQRTYVNTHAVSLLLRYALEELGLRRVQWKANSLNERSVRAAQRFGFELEGTLRWERRVGEGKPGIAVEHSDGLGSPDAGDGRHTVMLSICWDTWKAGVRERINELMSLPVKTSVDSAATTR